MPFFWVNRFRGWSIWIRRTAGNFPYIDIFDSTGIRPFLDCYLHKNLKLSLGNCVDSHPLLWRGSNHFVLQHKMMIPVQCNDGHLEVAKTALLRCGSWYQKQGNATRQTGQCISCSLRITVWYIGYSFGEMNRSFRTFWENEFGHGSEKKVQYRMETQLAN